MVDLDADAHQYRLDEIEGLKADIDRLIAKCFEQHEYIERLNEEVKRARNTSQFWKDNHLAGNKRIEQLEEALREIAQPQCNGAAGPDLRTCISIATAALAGEKKDD